VSAPVAPTPRQSLLVRYGNFLFRYRDAVFPIVLLALFFAFPPTYPRGSERLDNLLDVLGILVALTGQVFRALVIGYVYVIRGGKNRRVYAEDLVTEGFFAHSRNPLYLGNLLVLLGLFLIHGNPWVFAIGVPFFLLGYAAIVAAEEAYLRDKFGDAYGSYVHDVPRWFPRLRGLRRSLAGMHFNWRRVVLKEYGSTYAWTLGAVVLMAADTLAYFPYEARATYLNTLAVCLGLLTIGWGTARYLKLTKRLRQAPAS
jgi:protein-S-isoprenylcysteine O-methyltransferase Ste14